LEGGDHRSGYSHAAVKGAWNEGLQQQDQGVEARQVKINKGKSMIELQNVTKIFNRGRSSQFTALKDISLQTGGNRLIILKGASGAGKTTLLSLIGCMSRPTSGRILIDSRETTSLPEKFLAEIRRFFFGFVFQNYNLLKGITVFENVMIPAYPTGRNYLEVKEKAMSLLRQMNIEDKANRRIEDLSGGELQRTAIARALINDPAVIIADEPTAHLDTDLSKKFLDIVAGLIDEGRVFLIASHDPLVYEAGIVSQVIAMRDGMIH